MVRALPMPNQLRNFAWSFLICYNLTFSLRLSNQQRYMLKQISWNRTLKFWPASPLWFSPRLRIGCRWVIYVIFTIRKAHTKLLTRKVKIMIARWIWNFSSLCPAHIVTYVTSCFVFRSELAQIFFNHLDIEAARRSSISVWMVKATSVYLDSLENKTWAHSFSELYVKYIYPYYLVMLDQVHQMHHTVGNGRNSSKFLERLPLT